MLRIVLLSLFWAICSTCLVRPWFWKNVKNKKLIKENDNELGFTADWKFELGLEIVFFILMFIVSFIGYLTGNRQSIYGSFILIILCSIVQLVWANQGKKWYKIMLSIAAISAILWIQDAIASSNINVTLNRVNSVPLTATIEQEDTKVKLFVSEDEIKSLFRASSAAGPTYNNGKYVFEVSEGANGDGVVIIDEDNYDEAIFLSCEYEFNVLSLRSRYPAKKLIQLYITVSDDNTPYGLYAIADKTWFFGSYNVNKYAMFNLKTGEINEYSQEDLPSFVTNN